MSRVSDFVFGVACGGAATIGAMNYHVVRAESGVHVVRKLSAGLNEPYVDVRSFTPTEWNEHRALAAAIVRAGKGEILKDSSLSSFRTAIEGWVGGLESRK